MKGIDTEVIKQIILETSGNLAYTAKQLKSDRKLDVTIEAMRRKLAASTPEQRKLAQHAVARRMAELEAERVLDRVCVVVDFDMFYAVLARCRGRTRARAKRGGEALFRSCSR